MTEPDLRLEPTRVSVDPGGQATVVVTVFNPGNRVEGYDLDVVSQTPMPWASVVPPTLSVYPQQEESAVVTFAPPAGPQAQGGAFPFGVRVRSQVDAESSAVAEGDLEVGAVAGLQASLTPVTSSGRWTGRHTVRVSNWGNSPARLRVSPHDPDEALGFLVSPQVIEVPLGGESVARLKVRTRHPVLRGTNQRLPFQVVCEPEEPEDLGAARPVTSTPERPVVDGAFNQKPILTRAVVALAALVLLLGIGGVAYAVTHPDKQAPSTEQLENPDPPPGFKSLDTTSPTKITLVWDEMQDVDGFLLYYESPETHKRAAPIQVGNATTVDVKLDADTEMCFRLSALRAKLESELTQAVCDKTEPVGAPEEEVSGAAAPSVTVTPDPNEVAGGAGGSPDVSPDSSPDSGPASGDETPVDQPLAFVTSMAVFSPDSPGEASARARQAQLIAAGIPAKVLNTNDFELSAVSGPGPTGTPAPTEAPIQPNPTWIVYVDAPQAQGAIDACNSAWTTLEASGETRPEHACVPTYQVLSRPTPVQSRPTV